MIGMQEAIEVIEQYQQEHGHAGFLEALIEMQAQYEWLEGSERQAYRVFMAQARQMV